ncbi:hypothetical protein ACJ72_05351 [Emergomyces africanus]|uniref:Uncharacterized protein n=1 Tax=Emergomyces africanus TaxID=1955775 RepID=A0A1B7NU59_9EURO|nr:hypothetical protein ACJ72_05351 [Emergomyces africanus]
MRSGEMEKYYHDLPTKSDLDTESLKPLLPPEPNTTINNSPKRICLLQVYSFAVRILAFTGMAGLVIAALYKPPRSSTSLSPPASYTTTTSLRTIPPIELQQKHSTYGTQCGNSPAEARRLGCRFDMINFSWQPAACWDEALYAQFIARYKNIWYWETLDGEPVPVDEVLEGRHQLLSTTWEFYIVHCLYVMEQVARGSWPLPQEAGGQAGQSLLEGEWSPLYLHEKQCMLDLRDTGKHAGKTKMISVAMWYPACEPRSAN